MMPHRLHRYIALGRRALLSTKDGFQFGFERLDCFQGRPVPSINRTEAAPLVKRLPALTVLLQQHAQPLARPSSQCRPVVQPRKRAAEVPAAALPGRNVEGGKRGGGGPALPYPVWLRTLAPPRQARWGRARIRTRLVTNRRTTATSAVGTRGGLMAGTPGDAHQRPFIIAKLAVLAKTPKRRCGSWQFLTTWRQWRKWRKLTAMEEMEETDGNGGNGGN